MERIAGEPDNNQTFGLLPKDFFIFLDYFPEKEGFLNRLVV